MRKRFKTTITPQNNYYYQISINISFMQNSQTHAFYRVNHGITYDVQFTPSILTSKHIITSRKTNIQSNITKTKPHTYPNLKQQSKDKFNAKNTYRTPQTLNINILPRKLQNTSVHFTFHVISINPINKT